MANEITTIKLQKSTKERLDKLRAHKRETYDEILQRVLSILNLSRAEPEKAQRRLLAIEHQKRLIDGQKIKREKVENKISENITANINRKILKERK